MTLNMDADKDLLEELNKYPTSFIIIEEIGKLTTKYLKLKLDQLIKDLDIVSTKMEKCRTYNLISVLHFLTGDMKSAFEFNTMTQELDPGNIIGVSNHAQFLYKQDQHFGRIKQDCKTLKEMCMDAYKMVIAKAEIAFSYTRFGTVFYRLAQTLFQEVLTECKELDDSVKSSEDFKNNICLWYFGCGLTYKRLLNIVNVHHTSDIDLSRQNYKYVCELFKDIITMGCDSDICKLYKARAYVQLGELSYDIQKKDMFPNNLRDVLPENSELHMEVEAYFKKALELCETDVFVLERCGKHFRYTNQIPKSIELLQKAIDIKPTGLNHHHLAITLKRQLEFMPQRGHQRDSAMRELFGNKTDFRPTSVRNSERQMTQDKKSVQLVTVNKLTNQLAQVSLKNPPDKMPSDVLDSPAGNWPMTGKTPGRGNGSKCGARGRGFPFHKNEHSYNRSFSTPNKPSPNPILYSRVRSVPSGRECAAYRRCIKSPRKCQNINIIGNEETIELILFHLNESYKIGMNINAVYEKGLLFRQISKANDALETFRCLIRGDYGTCSLVTLANAYEQAGLCLDELLAQSLSDDKDFDEEDMKMYFKKSIEISSHLVSKVPSLEKCWTSTPTLISFLNRKGKTKNNLKDLKFLYEKINNYGMALQIIKELRAHAEDDVEETKMVEDKIKVHMKMEHFDDAVLAFDFIKCLPKWQERVDMELFITVHVDGAFHAFKNGHNKIASIRFENAFDFNRSKFGKESQGDQTEHDEENDDSGVDHYDIFILCDPNNEQNGIKLRNVLENLGIETTLNTEDVACGKLKSEGISNIINLSAHFIVVYDIMPNGKGTNRKLMHYFSIMNEIILRRNHGNIIVLVSTDNEMSKVPTAFSGYKKESIDFEQIDEYNIKPLLTSLAIGPE